MVLDVFQSIALGNNACPATAVCIGKSVGCTIVDAIAISKCITVFGKQIADVGFRRHHDGVSESFRV